MNKVATALSAACLLALAPSALAQKDRIVFTDGKVAKKAQVLEFTWRQIRYKEGGRTEMRSADSVASVEVARVRDAYKRAYGAGSKDEQFDNFLREARKRAPKDAFLSQFGYIEGARLLMQSGQEKDAFALLEEMVQKLPDSGFYPDLFRFKLNFYMSLGKEGLKDASTVAGRYSQVALRGGWPDGFANEAAFYEIMVRAVGEQLTGADLTKELKALLGKTEGAYPGVASRVKVQLAHSYRNNNEMDAARKAYDEILAKNNLDDGTRAQALLGIGHIHFADGDPTKTEPYRSALMSFLRVYLETVKAPDNAKAEALHFAALSCEKWRGPDSGQMGRRLKGLLRRNFPDSAWAKR